MSHPSTKAPLGAPALLRWPEQEIAAVKTPDLPLELLSQRDDVLPRFATHYTQLRALPRRARRALQRQWKQSLAGVALLFALGATPGQAATIPVSATCSLINAITAANTDTATGGCPRGNGADTIRLPVGSTQTLTTVNNSTYGSTGLPVVSSAITIEGRNSTIRRVSSDPDLFRIFAVNGTGTLTLKDTTITGGVASGESFPANAGGGIFNSYGVVTLEGSTLSGNSAGDTGWGGGVSNSGALTITNSTLSGNLATNGGGVVNFSTLTITNSTLSGNSVHNGGGGVSNFGALTLTNSTLSGNSAGDAGGGVANSGTLTLTNSTLSGNSAGNVGGGVSNFGALTLTNSTLSGNSAFYEGGGVFNFGTLTLTDSTLSGNSTSGEGGAVSNVSGATLTLTRTLVSGNTASSSGAEVYNYDSTNYTGLIIANNFNLFGHRGLNNTQAFSGFSPGGNDINATSNGINTPLTTILNPTLANNGGPTRTHALVLGSPALNAVMSGCPPPATDQRGFPRPQGPRCDIGAVEATFCGGSHFVTILGTSGNNVLIGTAGRDVIAGLGGQDTLEGLGGNDVLCGGEGNDTLRGSAGADVLLGEPGNDRLFGGPGPDLLLGQRGRDQLFGGVDNDELRGGPEDDVLNGEANRDVCDGEGHVQGDTAVNCEVVRNVP